VLFAGWLIRPREQAGMRFDERLAHGEDTDFFHRAVQRGARIVYAREPAVFETVPIERATLRFHVGRAYYYAASKSDFHRRHRGTATALAKLLDRLVVKAPVAIARLIAAPLVWPVSEPAFRHLLAKGSVRLVGIAGATAGILGFIGNPYRVIDGS
jgi:succinoglycan biosynthesis protein ExoM